MPEVELNKSMLTPIIKPINKTRIRGVSKGKIKIAKIYGYGTT